MCFFFKQKTAYEMRISDWSSDVCSSDLAAGVLDDEVTDLDAGGAHEPGPAKARAGSVLTALRNPTPPATSDTSTAMTGICQKARSGTVTSKGKTGTRATCRIEAMSAAASAVSAPCRAIDPAIWPVELPTALRTATSRRRSSAER